MDFGKLEAQLDNGKELQVTYKYPVPISDLDSDVAYQTRTDRLLAVEPSNGRVFVSFKGEFPVWIERDEVLMIEP